MLTAVRFDLGPMLKVFKDFEYELKAKMIRHAAENGGNVFVRGYRNELPRHLPTGTFQSAAGAVEHFVQAYTAVGQRTLMFKDGNGAYSVVGILAAPGNWRPLAPQATFIEVGTDEREHKDGHPTGRVTAQHVLGMVVEVYAAQAQAEFKRTLSQDIAAYVSSHGTR